MDESRECAECGEDMSGRFLLPDDYPFCSPECEESFESDSMKVEF
jgi:hypothetical protein